MSSPASPPLVQAVLAGAPKAESRDGAGIGAVHALLVDKASGRAVYAVLSLGGVLGLGRSYYPVPFDLLRYDPVRDLYVVTVDPALLKGGPSWSSHAPDFDAAYADRVARYYAGS